MVNQLVYSSEISLKDVHEALKDQNNIDACILCSVIVHPIEIDDYLGQTFPFIKFTQQTPVPLENEYTSKETLGLDRLASSVGANSLFPNEDLLIVDFGTCIKYDFVTNGAYQGGSIAPGMQMRFKALHNFTDQLPFIEPKEELIRTGKTTEESILSGVMFGISAEVKGIVNHYREHYQQLKVIFTGGDAHYFENVLKNNIFAAPNLVSRGLNEVLNYNEVAKK